MHPVQYTQAVIASAGTTMTTNGQLITTSLGNFPQQILPSLVPSNNHQPVIIRQYGTAANQQSLGNFRHKAVARSWKEHTYKFQNQLPVVRPNSFYASVVPVHSSQIFNGCHIGEISSQPQIITAQDSGTMLNQAQLQGIPTVNALPSGLSWTPSFYPYQNSFVLCNQPSGMTLQQIQPQMTVQPASATALPVPTSTPGIIAPMTKKRLKELKPKEKTIKQLSSTPVAQLKSVTSNQNGPNSVHIVNGQTKSTCIESKTASVETEISFPEQTEVAVPFSEILQASIAPTVDVSAVSMMPSTLTAGSGACTSPFPANTEIVSVNAEMNQAPSTSVAQPNVGNVTYPNQEQVVNDCTKSTGIESKSASVETEINSSEKSEAVVPVSEIEQASIAPTIACTSANIAPTSTNVDVSALSVTPSTLPIGSCVDTSPFPTNTKIISEIAEMNQAPSTSVVQPNVGNETYSHQEQVVNDCTKFTGIESKTMSESEILSTQKSQASHFSRACTASTINVSKTNSALTSLSSTDANPLPSNIKKSTKLAEMSEVLSIPVFQPKSENICSNPIQPINDLIKSTEIESKPVSAKTNIFSHQKSSICDVPTPTVNASVTSIASSYISSGTTSISSVVSTNSVSSILPFPCLTNKASDLDTKTSLPKVFNKAVVASHQTNTTDTIVTAEPLEPRQLIQKLSLEPIKKSQKPQIATVKPQIITHIIDGFIIEESSEPLPVSRQPFLDSPCKVLPSLKLKSPEKKENSLTGRRGRKRKRFRGKKRLQKQIFAEDESTNAIPDEKILPTSEDESMVSYKTDEDNSAPFDNSRDTLIELNKLSDDTELLKSDLSEKLPGKWTVEDVFEFLRNSPGYSEYADNFKSQEVDGQALLLLNEKHLQTTLCMKLGPALKLISQIKSIEAKLQL